MAGAQSAGGQEKEWIRDLLDDFGAFDIKPDPWTISAQYGGGWYKTVRQGSEFFITNWIAAERARPAV